MIIGQSYITHFLLLKVDFFIPGNVLLIQHQAAGHIWELGRSTFHGLLFRSTESLSAFELDTFMIYVLIKVLRNSALEPRY